MALHLSKLNYTAEILQDDTSCLVLSGSNGCFPPTISQTNTFLIAKKM